MKTRIKATIGVITLVELILGHTALAAPTIRPASPNEPLTLPSTSTAQLIQPTAPRDVLFQPNARIVGVE